MTTSDAEDPLGQQIPERVPYVRRLSIIDEGAGKAVNQRIPTLGGLQQDRAAIGAGVLLIKGGNEWVIEEVREENSLWYRRGRQRKRLRDAERTCGNGFLACGGVCVSMEIGPFTKNAG